MKLKERSCKIMILEFIDDTYVCCIVKHAILGLGYYIGGCCFISGLISSPILFYGLINAEKTLVLIMGRIY